MYSSLLIECEALPNEGPDLRDTIQKDLLPYRHDMTVLEQTRLDRLMDRLTSSKLKKQPIQNPPVSSSLEKLKEARSNLAETEEIAQDTLHRLVIQADQINRQKEVVKQTQANLSYGNKLLSRMSRFWRN